MHIIMRRLVGSVGLGLIISMAFETFASFSGILGPVGASLVIGSHLVDD